MLLNCPTLCDIIPVSGIPAENVRAAVKWEGDDYVVEIEGDVKSTALFKNQLTLTRNIRTKYDCSTITIKDEIKNEGFSEQGFMLLYHFNLGYPFLDDGTEVRINSGFESKRFSRYGEFEQRFEMTAPVDNVPEEVYFHHIREEVADVDVINRRLGIRLNFRYNTANLPYLIQWKSMVSGDYALGIEPANSLLGDRRKAVILSPGESAVNVIGITVSEIGPDFE